MFGTALWICSAVAVAVGLAHALYVYHQDVGEFKSVPLRHPFAIRLRAAYYALWTFLLWLLLGATVVAYWAIALIPYLIARAIGLVRKPSLTAGHGAGESS